MKIIIKLLRIKHWVKNLFIFIPIFFSGDLFSSEKLITTSIVFIGFSLIASFVYIINDAFDIDFDKNHPTKKNRPLASGQITLKKALLIGSGLLILGLSLIFYVSFESFIVAIIYFVLNILYSSILKHISIVDIIIISLGFVFRILIGGFAGEIELSKWIIIMVFLLSLFLAVSKRRDDVFQFAHHNKINRSVVSQYNLEFMDKLISIISTTLLVSYLIFISADEVMNKYPSEFHIFSFLFVIMGVFRYNQITYVDNKSGSPVKIFFNDIFLKLILTLWIILFLFIIYI
jgi:decaprenyl-phosphate phosphoribosyltransferase